MRRARSSTRTRRRPIAATAGASGHGPRPCAAAVLARGLGRDTRAAARARRLLRRPAQDVNRTANRLLAICPALEQVLGPRLNPPVPRALLGRYPANGARAAGRRLRPG